MLEIVGSRIGRSRNGRVRNVRSRIGRSRIGPSTGHIGYTSTLELLLEGINNLLKHLQGDSSSNIYRQPFCSSYGKI